MLRKSVSSKDARPQLHGGELTGAEMLKAVKPDAHRGLLNSIPTMLRHLRQDGISDPTLFLRRDRAMEFLAGDLLRSFFNNLNKQHDISVKLTREICAWRAPHVLACVISNVLEFSSQPLVPSGIALQLLGMAHGLRSVSQEKRIEMIADVLEEMPAWRFEILTAFVCFLHDCASTNADLAREIGPVMLLRDGVTLAPLPPRGKPLPEFVREQNLVNDEMAASEVFKVMIDDCWAVFDVPPAGTVKVHRIVAQPPRARSAPAAPNHEILNSSTEEKNMLDEEKSSVASLNALYDGITSQPVPRRRKSKKAAEFHSIIARTSSNVSAKQSNLSEGSLDSPISILKTNSDRFASRRTVGMAAAMAGVPPLPTNIAKSEQTSESAISAWQEMRPSPLITGARTSPTDSQSSRGKQSSANPLIKTQNSFSTNSRPSTPTSVLSARRSVLADLQTKSESNSPQSAPVMPALTLSEALEQPVAQMAAAEQDKTPERVMSVTPVRSSNVEQQGMPMYTAMSTITPSLYAAQTERQSSSNGVATMDADGPSIFERERNNMTSDRPRTAFVPLATQQQQPDSPASPFESELKEKAQVIQVEQQEEKSAEPEEAAPPKPVKPPKPPKRPSQPRHSFIPRVTSPRLSSTLQNNNAFATAANATDMDSSDAAEEDEQRSSSAEDSDSDDENESVNEHIDEGEGSQKPDPAENQEDSGVNDNKSEPPTEPINAFSRELAKRASSAESKRDSVISVASTKRSSVAEPGVSFSEQLARRRAEVESTPGAVSQSATPGSFEAQLAEKKRSIVALSPVPPKNSFEEQLTQKRASLVEPPKAEPNKPNQSNESPGGSKPGSGSSVGSQPPFKPRPKPVPPRLTPGVREIQRRSSMEPIDWTMAKRASVTQQPAAPNEDVQSKLANLRALLKPSGSGSMTPTPAPAPPPPDTKKRVPPPSDPPPPGQARLEKEPGTQIIGDWRTEWSPQHKCVFWVNILTGAVQWSHPMRERSLSTKNRQEQAKNFAPEVTGVTIKMPEPRRTIHEQKDSTPVKPTFLGAAANQGARSSITPGTKVDQARSLESLGRQSSSDLQKNMHRSYRRNSLQSEDYQAQQAAQIAESEALVIAAARAAGETVVECIFDFTPVDPNNKAEISIRVGEKLRVYEKGTDGWWGGVKISDGSQRGLFPHAYVKVI